jgi:nicotinamide riboside kinase
MKDQVKIVFTGPESTGKSTLSSLLSALFECVRVEEYARNYINQLDRPYLENDLIQIAEGQLHLEIEALKFSDFIICDTDLLTIKVWSEYKYGNCDSWIVTQLENNLPNLYLICYPDLKWEYDPQRENPNDGIELFNIYKAEVEKLGVPYKIIKGKGKHRERNARDAIEKLIL